MEERYTKAQDRLEEYSEDIILKAKGMQSNRQREGRNIDEDLNSGFIILLLINSHMPKRIDDISSSGSSLAKIEAMLSSLKQEANLHGSGKVIEQSGEKLCSSAIEGCENDIFNSLEGVGAEWRI